MSSEQPKITPEAVREASARLSFAADVIASELAVLRASPAAVDGCGECLSESFAETERALRRRAEMFAKMANDPRFESIRIVQLAGQGG